MSDKKLKVSVVTICYNEEKNIENTIKSVLAQDYDSKEYIIIDGKSTDNTMNIIAKYEEYIDTVVSEADGGIYDAMNKGISRSSGDAIIFMNSGDTFTQSNAISALIEGFENDDTDVVCGRVNKLHNNVISSVWEIPKDESLLFRRCIYPHQGMIAKRSLFDKYGLFDTSYRIVADYEWMLRLAARGIRFHVISKIVANFSIDGVSHTNTLAAAKEIQKAIVNNIPQSYSREMANDIIESIASYVYFEEAKSYFINNNDAISDFSKEFFNSTKGYYIWGCGEYGRICQALFEKNNIKIHGFIDSNKRLDMLSEYPILLPSEISKDIPICISTINWENEISSRIQDEQLTNEQVLRITDFIKKAYERR